MRYQNPFLDRDTPPDDIDKLFSQLQIVEPPPSFVSSLLSQLPTGTLLGSLFPQLVVWDNFDGWVMRNRKQQSC